MPAKPKRGTVPSLDGDSVDKRITFVKRKFHFRTISARFPHWRRTLAAPGNPRHYYACAIPHISAHPHTAPLKCAARPIYIYLKDTKQKNTSRIRGIAYLCARMGAYVRACGNVRKSGNPHRSCVCAFPPLCGLCADIVRKTLSRLHV